MKQLSCDEVEEQLPLLAIGDLTADEEHDLDTHARDCDFCAHEIAVTRRLAVVLDTLPEFENVGERVVTALPLLRERIEAALPRRAGYDRIDSPLGPLFLVVSGDGLCAVRFHDTEEDLVDWARSSDLRPSPDPTVVRPFARELREYFGRERTSFDLPVDLSTASPFVRRVLRATSSVPFGHLVSYKTIAREIGEPGATRAVGNALGHNPVPDRRSVSPGDPVGRVARGLHRRNLDQAAPAEP